MKAPPSLLVSMLMPALFPLAAAQAAPDATPALKPTPALEKQLKGLIKKHEPMHDYQPLYPIWAAFPEKSAHFYFRGEPGHCYWVVGAGGAGVRDVDLDLRDPDGSKLKEDHEDAPEMRVHFCHAKDKGENYQVDLTIKKGQGEVAMQVLKRKARLERPLARPKDSPQDDSGPSAAKEGPKPPPSPPKPPTESRPTQIRWPSPPPPPRTN